MQAVGFPEPAALYYAFRTPQDMGRGRGALRKLSKSICRIGGKWLDYFRQKVYSLPCIIVGILCPFAPLWQYPS